MRTKQGYFKWWGLFWLAFLYQGIVMANVVTPLTVDGWELGKSLTPLLAGQEGNTNGSRIQPLEEKDGRKGVMAVHYQFNTSKSWFTIVQKGSWDLSKQDVFAFAFCGDGSGVGLGIYFFDEDGRYLFFSHQSGIRQLRAIQSGWTQVSLDLRHTSPFLTTQPDLTRITQIALRFEAEKAWKFTGDLYLAELQFIGSAGAERKVYFPGYLWLEGESAQGHNFSAVVDAGGCSEGKYLHLWKEGPPGAEGYFARYEFTLPEDGVYKLWAAGTPTATDWASPFTWSLDGDKQFQPVLQSGKKLYANHFTWNLLASGVTLKKGTHSLVFKCTTPRQMDKLYVMYLDSILVIREDYDFTPDATSKPAPGYGLGVQITLEKCLLPQRVEPGKPFTFKASFSLRQKIEADLRLYLRLLYKGQVLFARDYQPVYPTSKWQAGKVYPQELTGELPFDAPAGEYQVQLGFYHATYTNPEIQGTVIASLPVGSPAPKAGGAPRVEIAAVTYPEVMEQGKEIPLQVQLKFFNAAPAQAKLFIQLWQGDLLFAVQDFPLTFRGGGEASVATVNLPFIVPEGVESGEYQLKAGLYNFLGAEGPLTSIGTVKVIAAKEGRKLVFKNKPLGNGVFVDREGIPHGWYITSQHVLLWDGEPFVPIGGMYCSRYITWYDPKDPAGNAQRWAADVKNLEQIKAAGIKDLYINPVRGALGVPTWAWQHLFDYLDQEGFRYGLEFTDGPPRETPGFLIRAREDLALALRNVTRSGVYPWKFTLTNAPSLEALTAVHYLVVDNASGKVLAQGKTTGKLEGKELSGELELQVKDGQNVSAYFIPEVVFSYGTLNNFWDGYAAYEQRVKDFLGEIHFGPGFRFIVDPFTNEMGIWNAAESMRIATPAYEREFAVWLEQKYQTLEKLTEAWQLNAQPEGWEEASRLIPAIAEAGPDKQGILFDPEKGAVYYLNTKQSQFWDDNLEFRGFSVQRYTLAVADAIKSVVNVPVIYKHTGVFAPYFVNPLSAGGFDGLGMEAYGSGHTLTAKGGYALSEALQSARTMWLLVTETELTENISQKQKQEPGYPSYQVMADQFNRLLAAGARGIYDFGLHLEPADALKNYIKSNVPEQLEWIARFGKEIQEPAKWQALLTQTPNVVLCYPYGRNYWFNPSDRGAFLPNNDYKGGFSTLLKWFTPEGEEIKETTLPSLAIPTSAPEFSGPYPLLLNFEDAPASLRFGKDLETRLQGQGNLLIYLGFRKDLGAVPWLDRYFTPEFAIDNDGRTFQVLTPSPTGKVLYASQGKPWGIKEGNLLIFSKEGWLETKGIDPYAVKLPLFLWEK